VCITFQPTFDFCSVPNLPHLPSICPFFSPTVASNSYSSWEESPSNLWTLPTFSELASKTCDDLTPLSQLLRFKFVPTMRRNLTFGYASSRPSLQQRGSNHKNSNMAAPSPACPSKSFRTFWTPSMSSMTLPSRLTY
jgi:hypothetical protein